MRCKNAIIIPVHNRKKFTLSCLDYLHQGKLDATIFLVDDGSSDGTADSVTERYPDVEIVHGDGDLYWTGGMSLGMKNAYEMGAEVFVWLNDDTLIDPIGIRSLTEKVEQEPKRIIAPLLIRSHEGSEEVTCSGCVDSKRIRLKPVKGSLGKDVDVEMLSGYCVAFSRYVIERIGFPDAEKFPHYYGDNSYTLMAHQEGFRLTVCGDVTLMLTDFHSSSFAKFILIRRNTKKFHTVFRAKKSPYLLKAMKNFMKLRYGPLMGGVTYFVKASKLILTFYLVRFAFFIKRCFGMCA